jgi:hypothetical protein
MSNLPRLGELLIEAGVVTQAQLGEALAQQRLHGGRLGTNLVELGFVDEKTLSSLLARQLTIPSATAAQLDRCDPLALQLLPPDVADKLRAIPLREDAGRLWVAMADPTDQSTLTELARLTKRNVRPMVAPELLIQYALERHYQVKRKLRVVQVRTPTSDLLRIDAPRTPIVPTPALATAGTPPPADAAASAPVWSSYGQNVPTVDVDDLAGYLDDGPERPEALPARVSLREVAGELVAALSDDAILDVALRFVAQDVQRLAAFVLRHGSFSGWRGLGVDGATLRRVQVALDDAPLVARALSSGEAWVGRLKPSELGGLAAPLGASETLGVVLPLRIGRRAVGAIVGLDASLEALRHKSELDKLALKIDQALHIGYLRRLILSQ